MKNSIDEQYLPGRMWFACESKDEAIRALRQKYWCGSFKTLAEEVERGDVDWEKALDCAVVFMGENSDITP